MLQVCTLDFEGSIQLAVELIKDKLQPLGLASMIRDGDKNEDGTFFALPLINMKCAMKFPVNGVDADTLSKPPPAHWVLYIPHSKRSPALQAAIDLATSTDSLKTFLCFPKDDEQVCQRMDARTEDSYSTGAVLVSSSVFLLLVLISSS
jgi:hypothetical protein